MSDSNLNRRQVLSATGAAIVGGALMTGSAAADGGSYTAELTGEPLGVDTNAGGTATVSVSDGEASYELWVSCLRDGTHVSLSADGEVLAEYDLDVHGVVRDTVVLEGTTDDEALLDALEGEVRVTAHTEQNPDGEIEGTLSAVDEADPAPEEPAEDEEPEEEPDDEEDDDPEGRPILITATDAETGDPIEGADVHMASADGDPDDAVEYEFTTDSDGTVEESPDIGNFILTIEAEGYETYSTELSLDDEHHAELEPEDGGDPDLHDALEVVDRQTDVGHDTEDEYVLFENTSDSEVDLTGHAVTDREEGGTGIEAPFPDGFTLGPGEQVRVTSGPGSPTDDEIFMDSERAVWREDGDEVLIVGPGGTVVFSYSYGDGGTSSIQFVFNQVRSLFA